MNVEIKKIFELIKSVNERLRILRPEYLAKSRIKVAQGCEIGEWFNYKECNNLISDGVLKMKLNNNFDSFLEATEPFFIEMKELHKEINSYTKDQYKNAYNEERERLLNIDLGIANAFKLKWIDELQKRIDQFVMPEYKNGIAIGKLNTFQVIDFHRQMVFDVVKTFEKFGFFNPLNHKKTNKQPQIEDNYSLKIENPHPRIFLDYKSFKLFEALKENIRDRYKLVDSSFIYRKMQEDGFIYEYVGEKEFQEFLFETYQIEIIEQFKTIDKIGNFDHRLRNYKDCITLTKDKNTLN